MSDAIVSVGTCVSSGGRGRGRGKGRSVRNVFVIRWVREVCDESVYE